MNMNNKQGFIKSLIDTLNSGWSIQVARQIAKKESGLTKKEVDSIMQEHTGLSEILTQVSFERKEKRRFFHRRGSSGY